MKLKELKHNHSLTDLLKVLIFSILMITPLLSVATRCLYVICNKNAYKSYYGETINQETYEQVNGLIDLNDDLKFDYQGNILETEETYQFYINASNVNINGQDINVNQIEVFTYNQKIYFGIDNVNYPITNLILYFTYEGSTSATKMSIFYEETKQYFYIKTYNDYSYIDNVFEYAVNKLAESPILSWTQQTAIYTGVNTMTTQLGISTPTIPMLIVYWFLLTVIYIIIDIIIKLFTWLTHMIGSKAV